MKHDISVNSDGASAPREGCHGVGGRATSVVIVVFNQLEYTRICLHSLRAFTFGDTELVVIDNGSTDGTSEELSGQPDIKLVQNTINRGFPAAANQGILASRGDVVVLLNNDTIVTPGWDRRLRAAMDSSRDIGLVGPCSNHVSGAQQVPVSYDRLEDLNAFAEEHTSRNENVREDVDRLVGFCLMIKRDALSRVGLLDERFGIGNYEDDDYCRRAIAAGYRCVIARDCFIHHFGSRTFKGAGIDLGALLAENRQKYLEKCGSAQVSPAALRPSRPKLSLCMIVRDNARTLGAALESIRDHVDEMVVVDTGSIDATPEIARSLGARVFTFPWCDDFAAARNESLRLATGDWVFWMDSDDTVPLECARQLRSLIGQASDPALMGFVMQVHCPSAPGGDGAVTKVDHVKLFRKQPNIRFEGRIHEQVLPSIRRAGGDVGWTDLYVVHSGSDQSEAGRQRKLDRDLRILRLEDSERPGHPFTLFNLGMTLLDAGDPNAAIEVLERSITASTDGESHVRKAYALLAAALEQAGRRDDAASAIYMGLQRFPSDPELLFRSAIRHHAQRRLYEAHRAYRAILDRSPEEPRHFSSVDAGVLSYKTRHNYALLLFENGQLNDAQQQWRTVLRERPGYEPALRGLVDAMVAAGDTEGALVEMEQWPSHMAKHLTVARTMARPRDLKALRDWCQVVFEHGTAEEAIATLTELTRRCPEDGAAHYNLGLAHFRAGNSVAAADCLRQSLVLRPGHRMTLDLLELITTKESQPSS
jgi:GT2 family glycosyltransferase/tetratricopeptide (TPR) repeat protein